MYRRCFVRLPKLFGAVKVIRVSGTVTVRLETYGFNRRKLDEYILASRLPVRGILIKIRSLP